MTQPSAIFRLAKGRPRSNPDARRERILQIAEKTFVELGYLGTTMELISTRCLISKKTLYDAFSSKKELFAAVLEMQSRVAAEKFKDNKLTIGQMLEALLLPDATDDADGHNAILEVVYNEAQHNPELWSVFRAAIDMECQRLAEWFRHEKEEGSIEVEDPLNAARMLINIVLGHSPHESESSTRTTYLRDAIALFSRGIEARHSPLQQQAAW
jgi:AcrR family transcriptional regulator